MNNDINIKGKELILQSKLMDQPSLDFKVHLYKDTRNLLTLEHNRELMGSKGENKGILVLYTGGTIGSAPKDDKDSKSPLIVRKWPELMDVTGAFASEKPNAINFPIDVIGFDEPLDSANVGPLEWNIMANILEKYMDDYEGFVILHGTDTLVYTASALSFMLENLKKPVILTGSQLSAIGPHIRSDAQRNLITAIFIANGDYLRLPMIPEVCICFDDKVFRGNRANKIDSFGFNAYSSLNYPPLAVAGVNTEIDTSRLLQPDENSDFRVNYGLDTNVVVITVYPGIQNTNLIREIGKTPGLRAIILKTYGTGNVPTNIRFLEQIKDVTEAGIIVMNVTQCLRGYVDMGLYETSAVLSNYEVISGWDITTEAALTKLMVLLGDKDITDIDELKTKAQMSLRGEQSISIWKTRFKMTKQGIVDGENMRVRIPGKYIRDWGNREILSARLYFHGARITTKSEDQRLSIKIFANLTSEDDMDTESIKFACEETKLSSDNKTTYVFDIFAAVGSLRKGKRNSFTISKKDENACFKWDDMELALFLKEKR